MPKSSRRDVKVPLKYRDEDPEQTKPRKQKEIKTPDDKKETVLNEIKDDEAVVEGEAEISPSEATMEDVLKESALVAVKSEPARRSIKELSMLGMGTFAIDEDTAKNMASGRFVTKVKIKRCYRCKGCKTKNCKQCVPCR